jgi:type II secretory pathway component PulL
MRMEFHQSKLLLSSTVTAKLLDMHEQATNKRDLSSFLLSQGDLQQEDGAVSGVQ